jgi:hypothetical protein
MKRSNGRFVLLGLVAAMGGCAERHIYFVPDCDERLAVADKRIVECHACVERPIPHEFLPKGTDGERCSRR